MTTPDPTTPALLSAARPVLAWTKQDEIQGRHDEWEAYAGPYRLRVERRGENDYQDADGDSTPHPDLVTAQLAAEALCRARLPLNMAGDRRALDALTAPAPADGGEALGRMLNEIRSRLIRRALDGYPGRAGVEEEMAKIDVESAVALDAHGYARGVAAGEAERARLTAELAGAHDRAIVFGRNVVASTERAMQAKIDAMAAELAEARAGHDRMRHARDLLQVQVEEANERADKAEAAARRDGAREERARWQDICADLAANPEHERTAMIAVGRARLDEARRARGEGQGS